MVGMFYPSPSQDTNSHGYGHTQGYSYSSYPTNSYTGTSSDTQHILQILTSLENQLLQSMQNQEDTKCVQGGGGTVIVRM